MIAFPKSGGGVDPLTAAPAPSPPRSARSRVSTPKPKAAADEAKVPPTSSRRGAPEFVGRLDHIMTAIDLKPIEGALTTAEAVYCRHGPVPRCRSPIPRTSAAAVAASSLGAGVAEPGVHPPHAGHQGARGRPRPGVVPPRGRRLPVRHRPSGSRPGPQLIAHDPQRRVIVLSDLGTGRSMTDLLARPDVEVTRAVSAWGQALGRMHAATVGGEQDFQCTGPSFSRAIDRRRSHRLGPPGRRGAADRCPRRWAWTCHRRSWPDSPTRCASSVRGEFRAFQPAGRRPGEHPDQRRRRPVHGLRVGAGFRDASLDVALASRPFPSTRRPVRERS